MVVGRLTVAAQAAPVKTIIVLAALLVATCGQTAAQPAATATPVQPASADVTAQVRFEPFRNTLGDQLEAINVRLATNIPIPVRVQIALSSPDPMRTGDACVRTGTCPVIHHGNAYDACQPDGCLVRNGRGLADFWCSVACLAGPYKVTLDGCSYAENKGSIETLGIHCNKQETAYLAWVGHWAANLAGNPLAVTDPDHSSILNLRREVTVVH